MIRGLDCVRQGATKVALMAVIIGLAACSSNKATDPLPLVELDEKEVRFEKQWRSNAGKGQDDRYSRLTPVIIDENIYTTDIKGCVRAFSREDGKRLWQTKLKVEASGGIGQAMDKLVLGTYNAQVIALDVETGDELWRSKVTSEVLSAPQGNSDVIVVQTSDGRVAGLNAEDGTERWHYDSNLPVLTLRGTSQAIVRGDKAFVGFANGKMAALDMNKGTPLWEQRIAIPKGKTDLDRVVDIDGSPLLNGELLFASSYQGRMMAMSASNGRPLWAVEASTANNLSSDGDAIYLSEGNDTIRSLNIGDGSERWRNEQMLRRTLNGPIVVDYEYVLMADEKGYVHVLSVEDGRYLGRKRVDRDGVRSPMLVSDETFYILDNSGNLTAYQLSAIEREEESDDEDDESDVDESDESENSDDSDA